ncbi:ABC transporter thiamine pyrophosphate-binding lipoprotein p37/Cypl [Mycoplasma sp. 653B]|uniref:ABC transporter thiamine pyrophosphate-binding lipoprotein p37/Cypl n=1 Tax=Mycoplasma sp. 653B TaxID=3401677 RepID=UPI003AADD05B
MNKFKTLLMGASLVTATLPIIASQCNGSGQADKDSNAINSDITGLKQLKLDLITPWELENNTQGIASLRNNIENRMNQYLAAKKANFTVKVKMVNDDKYKTVAQNISKGETDLGFISSGSIISEKNYLANFNPNIIQTWTSKFAGDIKDATFSTTDSNLETIAQNEQAKFDLIPWSEQWNDAANGNGWNGSAYTKFYQDYSSTSADNLVSYQRGLIAIVADDDMTAKIKQAWANKNLAQFLSYGIGLGKASSGSKYILPEALMKKQFNSANNKQFLSFADLQSNKQYQNTFVKAALKDANDPKNSNIHIFFDNEGVYAFTHFKASKQYAYAVNNAIRPNQKISFLTVTDPLPYNIGIASKQVADNDLKLVTEALNDLASGSNPIYGRNIGFVSYSDDTLQNFKNKIDTIIGE